MANETIIRALINEADAYLTRFEGSMPQIAAVRAGLACALRGGLQPHGVPSEPRCGYLDEAIGAVSGADELRAAITAARPHLSWITYDAYGSSIGLRFPKAHAFAPLLSGDDFELGLFLIAPRTLYRDHRHPAPELYAPLTGPHGWRFGVKNPWETREAHLPVWNETMAVHATLVHDVPFLCLFAWTRDVNAPAVVVEAVDWETIEAGLR